MTTTRAAMPGFDDQRLAPLTSDESIEHRVADLIGRANSRQLWLLFLDELDLQLPLLIPIDGLPLRPSETHASELAAELIEKVRVVMGEIGASSIVVVIERYGPAALTPDDAEWARALRGECEASGVVLRGQLLSHRSGVRWIAEHDLDSGSTAGT